MKAALVVIGIVIGFFVLIRISQQGVARMEDAANSTITFTSDPPGATVYISQYGTFLQEGQTPVEVELENGTHAYKVAFYDFEDEFDLYKPYSGRINVTKDDGVNVWLDRRTAEEIAQRQQAKEAEAAAAQAEQEAALDARRVYYRVETDCPSGVNLTYTNIDGNTTQISNRSSEWYYAFVPSAGDFLYLSAQNQCDYGSVTTKFIQDDVTLQENTSSGAYVIASVSGRWE